MQDRDDLVVESFEWDERNLPHAGRHGVSPDVADDVLSVDPRFYRNKEGMAGTHMMIGPDWTGRYWTIIIRPSENLDVWRPITGWPSDRREIRRYDGVE